ncbi:hypothetical protein PVL29_011474 [Vitis rotundifolia]|uniref:AAA+ ATPase domain-containing protein n=1 Tax=Vitis rotundifolia TaxID=103349 RepID=A0AA38ZNM4_VITRO|nr:hypothetical protein PVL29_011474 [Vitis rotundifolia]
MEFLSSIVGLVPCFYDHTSKHTVSIRDLKKNLQALSKEMVDLNNLYEDVRARVERAEQRQMPRRKEVGGWICEVEDMVKGANQILQQGDQEIQKRCLGCCPRNCWSSYRIGKAVSEKLVAVSGQIAEGRFDVVADMLPRSPVDELPLEETVGSELTYYRICRFLKDPQVRIMGLYGIGGVGKTTLLKKINNEFPATSNDSQVVVSKSPDIEKIQQVIWIKLEIPRDKWETRSSSREEKAVEILRVLKRKRFIFLLDDIWEELDLLEMEVPRLDTENKSKIVLTTHSLDVCHQMKAQKCIEVACLESEAAWTLFRKEAGKEILNFHPDILMLAKVVAEECKGLPLALVTLGRAMAVEKDPSTWDKVIQDLRKSPAEIRSMEDKLFHWLKLSYDRLLDNASKSYFIYHSMFQEDWEVYYFHLIELWIGEGFLGDHACLLENCGSRERKVKIHDVIRDMALWLYSEHGVKKNKILVYNKVARLDEDQETSKLKKTEKISLWDIDVGKFPKTLVCPNLKTLFVKKCHNLKKFPSVFFQNMLVLRVLDLSANYNLSELPTGIGKLGALRYLNLSDTRIRESSTEIKNLKNLMILIMDGMESLEIIPQDMISSLISLRLFSIYKSNITSGVEETLLEELESLNDISEISTTICNALSFNKLKSSQKLQRCISYLNLHKWGDVISLELSFSFFKKTEHLKGLYISHCDKLKDMKIDVEREGIHNDITLPNKIAGKEEYFHTLRFVNIEHCSKLLDLTWLVYAPYLERLYVKDCESIEEVICDDSEVCEIKEILDIFSRLKYLNLNRLPRLKSIYQHPLLFPSLEIIKVCECKGLRSLPFDSSTLNNNETIKHSFTLHFQIHEAKAYSTDTDKSEIGSIDDMPVSN